MNSAGFLFFANFLIVFANRKKGPTKYFRKVILQNFAPPIDFSVARLKIAFV